MVIGFQILWYFGVLLINCEQFIRIYQLKVSITDIILDLVKEEESEDIMDVNYKMML